MFLSSSSESAIVRWTDGLYVLCKFALFVVQPTIEYVQYSLQNLYVVVYILSTFSRKHFYLIYKFFGFAKLSSLKIKTVDFSQNTRFKCKQILELNVSFLRQVLRKCIFIAILFRLCIICGWMWFMGTIGPFCGQLSY